MRNHSEILGYWPSLKTLAEDIGENPENVWKWKQRGRIPAASWEAIVSAAAVRKYPVDLEKLACIKARKKRES